MNASSETPWAIHSIIPRSVANGPGERFVIWVQGCSLACTGCFNPDTHEPHSPKTTVEAILRTLSSENGLTGITVTGGEPLEQPQQLALAVEGARKLGLNVIVLTGYTRDEIEASQVKMRAIQDVDLVIHGRFNSSLMIGHALRGSSNKDYWLRSQAIRLADLEELPIAEILIHESGIAVATGMLPGVIPTHPDPKRPLSF